jgi:hypothetical protein
MSDPSLAKEDVYQSVCEAAETDRDHGRPPSGVSVQRLAGPQYLDCEESEVQTAIRELVFQRRIHSVDYQAGREFYYTALGYLPRDGFKMSDTNNDRTTD